ncbi:MAG TPA: thioredoxin family protein [Candidatus Limnocylindrales bacterium]|nr:thioredoxin family protein [Candidatus Limnocylindrales bacterium]
MVATASDMLPLGTPAPDFRLPDAVSGREYSLADFDEQPLLLVMFLSNHCPYVVHVRGELGRLALDYADDVAVVAIAASDLSTHPQDGPEHMKRLAEDLHWTFPYLFDETQETAKAYHAACTPDFFLFDEDRLLIYRGQLDGSRPSNDVPVTGADLREAIEAALEGRPPLAEQKPSLGCNIKWKPGNEPDYFARTR